VRAPGVFDLQAMSSVQYGYAYLVAFWLKPVLGLAVLLIVDQARRAPWPAPAFVDGQTSPPGARRLSLGYGALVLLLLANVVVLIYLHSLSHLGANLAPG